MERNLILSKEFKKSFKKFAGKNAILEASVEKAFEKLKQDAFDTSLKTHKLSGKLASYFACSCGYDCRIIFIIEKDLNTNQQENIVLLDIGTHDAVY